MRLICKFAQSIDGIDLSRYAAGDLIEIPRYEAELLIAEQWAEAIGEHIVDDPPRCTLDTAEWLCEIPAQMELKSSRPLECRRTEDRYREELRDSRAKTLLR